MMRTRCGGGSRSTAVGRAAPTGWFSQIDVESADSTYRTRFADDAGSGDPTYGMAEMINEGDATA